ncbi:MAG: hypothetical protein AB1715_08390, partial [Acidobacteriota bacterium]
MSQRPRFILCFACFLLFFLTVTGWLSGKSNISHSPGLWSLSPRIAVDSVGNVHAVWAEYIPNTTNGDAYYSRYDVGTKEWSVPLTLSNKGRVFSEEKRPVGIAIDGFDNIYVIYVGKNRISIRIFSGGAWG